MPRAVALVRAALWTGTAIGIFCLVVAGVLWATGEADPPGTATTTDRPGQAGDPDEAPQLLGRCVRDVCLTPADPGLQAALDYNVWRLSPASLDVLDLTAAPGYAALVARNQTTAVLGVVDLASGEWAYLEQVPSGTRPLWGDGALHFVLDDVWVQWAPGGTRTTAPAPGRLVAWHEGPVWTCGDSLCGRTDSGTWQRSLWPGYALSIGLDSSVVDLETGTVHKGAFWDGLSGDGALGAWLQVTPNGTRMRFLGSDGVATVPGMSDVAPAVSGPWIVYARGANVLAHRPDMVQTVSFATVPAGYSAYPLAAADGVAVTSLHPEEHGENHYLAVLGIPQSAGATG